MSTTLTKGSRVTGESRAELSATVKRQYDAGESIRDIAEGLGRSYGAIHRMLTQSGVEFRPRGGGARAARAAKAARAKR